MSELYLDTKVTNWLRDVSETHNTADRGFLAGHVVDRVKFAVLGVIATVKLVADVAFLSLGIAFTTLTLGQYQGARNFTRNSFDSSVADVKVILICLTYGLIWPNWVPEHLEAAKKALNEAPKNSKAEAEKNLNDIFDSKKKTESKNNLRVGDAEIEAEKKLLEAEFSALVAESNDKFNRETKDKFTALRNLNKGYTEFLDNQRKRISEMNIKNPTEFAKWKTSDVKAQGDKALAAAVTNLGIHAATVRKDKLENDKSFNQAQQVKFDAEVERISKEFNKKVTELKNTYLAADAQKVPAAASAAATPVTVVPTVLAPVTLRNNLGKFLDELKIAQQAASDEIAGNKPQVIVTPPVNIPPANPPKPLSSAAPTPPPAAKPTATAATTSTNKAPSRSGEDTTTDFGAIRSACAKKFCSWPWGSSKASDVQDDEAPAATATSNEEEEVDTNEESSPTAADTAAAQPAVVVAAQG